MSKRTNVIYVPVDPKVRLPKKSGDYLIQIRYSKILQSEHYSCKDQSKQFGSWYEPEDIDFWLEKHKGFEELL